MDPILNCLTGVCCPPEQQRIVLAEAFQTYCGLDKDGSTKAAQWMLSTFDLAEAGSLTAFKASVARLARGKKYGA